MLLVLIHISACLSAAITCIIIKLSDEFLASSEHHTSHFKKSPCVEIHGIFGVTLGGLLPKPKTSMLFW